MCTFEKCSAHLFQSRREWTRHELENHRKEWRCSLCSLEHFESAKSLDDHTREHDSTYTREQISSMQSLSEQYPRVVPMSACVFCDWQTIYNKDGTSHCASQKTVDLSRDSQTNTFPVVPVEQFQKHVSHHLEQLALFALPPPIKESSQTSSNLVAMSYPSRGFDEKSVSKTSVQSSTPVNSDPLPELYFAVTRGDVALVKKLLKDGGDPYVLCLEDAGILQVAAVEGHTKVVELLVDAGADVNAQNGDRGSALLAASAGGYTKVVELLVDAGADVNTQNGDRGSALLAASRRGDYEMVQLLLDAGVAMLGLVSMDERCIA